MRLENKAFLDALHELYGSSKERSVWVTVKSLEGEGGKGHRVLVRATNGDRKISTEVEERAMNKFRISLSSQMKSDLTGLKRGPRAQHN